VWRSARLELHSAVRALAGICGDHLFALGALEHLSAELCSAFRAFISVRRDHGTAVETLRHGASGLLGLRGHFTTVRETFLVAACFEGVVLCHDRDESCSNAGN